MKWLEEIKATRRSLPEIGLLTVVREVFHNQLSISIAEADDIFGAGWRSLAEKLRLSGTLEFRISGNSAASRDQMRVIAKGDGRRKRSKKAQMLKRGMNSFEQRITEGTF